MRVIALIQGSAFFCSIALAAHTHNVVLGVVVCVTVVIMHALVGGALFIMRRVRNYRQRVATMELVRNEVFKTQYGSKRQVNPNYRYGRTYTVG